MAESLAGKLLIANPLMGDPNFYRGVVFILEDNSDGSMGLVLNRETGERVAIHLPMWADTVSPPEVVFIGGPVEPDIAVGLGSGPAVPTEGWSPVIGNVGLVDLAFGPDHWGGFSVARVFAGYSGWEAGQLLDELSTQSWIICDAQPSDAFDDEPTTLWRRVLARQPGRISMYAQFPVDPRSN